MTSESTVVCAKCSIKGTIQEKCGEKWVCLDCFKHDPDYCYKRYEHVCRLLSRAVEGLTRISDMGCEHCITERDYIHWCPDQWPEKEYRWCATCIAVKYLKNYEYQR